MSYNGGYCPNCDNYITAPLLPLDYYKCNSCMMAVHVDDLVVKRNHAVGMGGIPPRAFDFRKIASATLYDVTQNTDTVSMTGIFQAYDYVVVVVSTCGANQHPNTVIADGTTLTQVVAAGSQSHVRTSVYYGQVLTHASNISVQWTGQHPHAAVVTAYVVPLLGQTPVLASAQSTTLSSTTSLTPGNTLSPTSGNAYALYVVGVEGGDGTIANIPSGYSLSAHGSTGTSNVPIDCEQAVFVQDLTSSATINSSTPLAGATWNAQCIAIFGKP